MGAGLGHSNGVRGVSWTLAGIIGLLLITAVAIVPLTLTILQLRQSDALVIDLAGQQRMLLERHMKELLLAADEFDSPYQPTRDLLRERLAALIQGGPTMTGITQREPIVLPSAPTDEIRETLLRQQGLLEAFHVKADRFRATPRSALDYRAVRDDVLADGTVLLRVANDAVAMLTRHAEARVRSVIQWELVVVLLVVGVASVGTLRFVQTENALRRSQATAMESLRQSDAVKSSLLSSVSHELRTPLTAIKTMVFNLQDDPSVQPLHVRQEFLNGIHEELDYLNQLFGNLLDMSRLEAGALKPNREWHLLDELAEGAIRRVGPRLERRALRVELSPDLPPIYVDGLAIQQVLINLLDNAVKFSPDGSPVKIAASVSGGEIEVAVTNEGEGIPSADLVRVFERFYRATGGRVPATPGAGLGLAICKGIVESHGGRIVARSIPGQETVISFRVPLMRGVPSQAGEVILA